MTIATAAASRVAKARSSAGATAAIESPCRSGITAPITPDSRTTGTTGWAGRQPAGRRNRKRSARAEKELGIAVS